MKLQLNILGRVSSVPYISQFLDVCTDVNDI